MDYASRFGEFNPAKLPKGLQLRVNPLKYVVMHFTVAYYNSPEYHTNKTPVEEFNPKTFMHSMVQKHGLSCCSPHEVIERDGRDFQFARENVRLRHIAGFDSAGRDYNSESFGMEIESRDFGSITNRQLEAAMYRAANVMIKEHLLEKYPLEEIFRGHGELWSEFATAHPLLVKLQSDLYPVRTDFTASQMARLMPIMKNFLTDQMSVKLL